MHSSCFPTPGRSSGTRSAGCSSRYVGGADGAGELADRHDGAGATHALVMELVDGATWREMLEWPQHERDLVGETLFRFVFRSLYGMRAFNGDPHPGNYLFHRGGRVTFLDFGLVKHFSDDEMHTFIGMVKAAAYDHDIVEPPVVRGNCTLSIAVASETASSMTNTAGRSTRSTGRRMANSTAAAPITALQYSGWAPPQ